MTPNFPPIRTAPAAAGLRAELRAFFASSVKGMTPARRARSWSGWDEEFSRALGQRGWIGMTWPEELGGRGASQLERYAVVEELLAAGAPVAAHWIADRQSGALLLRYGNEALKADMLPRIAAGELYFCIGMSEPGAGSDLASLRTRATATEGGWRVNGSKIWTTHAQHCHYMIALVRTGADAGDDRHAGFSQLVIELASPGVTVRPIEDQTGDAHFCEIFLDDVFVPAEQLLGQEGEGWNQVTAELALERSGPERFLSSHVLIEQLLATLCDQPGNTLTALTGAWAAELWTLRQMSLAVAAKLESGENPMIEASIVKDLGARFEQSVPRDLQAAYDDDAWGHDDGDLRETLSYLTAASPSFSLRGGTREILRGIIARGLGLR
ncbi:acyl-CoA dehydrogenase family protein [Parasphingopyxis marina]|uniref:Acyl-CoA dehydrogenase family protein n=1 Tax=Parasphingopyxis marina TaxID=2761622 RepID=A0A842I2B4_9SPHN|nr:acyl-CoA dehydrogenase family protein [Parasphingopyxis marina]MBC2778981.1 acyl-CoA dehydrogenase family protein [Parasphingopyxis marina]